MLVVLVLAVTLLLAFRAWLDHQQKLAGRGPAPALEREVHDLAERLDRAEAERGRLAQRVRHLEAIVTTEAFDRAREEAARLGLPGPAGSEAEPEGDETAGCPGRRLRH